MGKKFRYYSNLSAQSFQYDMDYKSKLYFIFYFAEIANHLSLMENNDEQFKW